MVHYTCDMCGKPLLVDEDTRYVVRVEVFAAYDPLELTEEDIEADHLEEISHLIEKMERMDPEELEDDVYKSFRLDLCPACRKKFVEEPLAVRPGRRIPYNEN